MDRRIEERERQTGASPELLSTLPDAAALGPHDTKVEKSTSVKIVGEDGQEREYHSLDAVPREIQAELEALEAAASKRKPDELSITETSNGVTVTTRTNLGKDVTAYKLVDEQGVERVYHSLEEMPPELRAAVAEAERKLGDRRS